MPRFKRAALLIEDDDGGGGLLFEAQDSLDLGPRAHDVFAADLPTLRSLARAHGDVDTEVVARWRGQVPGLIRDDTIPEELAELRRFAADRRFMLEFVSATETMGQSLDTESYHQEVIDDADAQFDDVETTLAHLFALPSAALAGRHFGGAFADAVCAELGSALDRCVGNAGGIVDIVELGCGTGRFANDFLDRLKETRPAVYARVRYTLVDLSPALQASQRRRCAGHGDHCRFVLGDLLAFAGQFDVVISNEVIADLPVRAVYRDVVDSAVSDDGGDAGEAARALRRFHLDTTTAPHAFLVNTGAIELVARLPRLLKPGGLAVVTEYGSLTRSPIRVVLGGHVEHSIHFGHLESVARQVGLEPGIRRVVDFVGLDEETAVVELEGLDVLRRAGLPFLGLPPLPRMAFTAAELQTAVVGACGEASVWGRLHGLQFVPVRGHPMRADLFLALVARRAA